MVMSGSQESKEDVEQIIYQKNILFGLDRDFN